MKKSLTISLIVLLVLAIAAGIYFFLSQRRTKIEMQEMVEQEVVVVLLVKLVKSTQKIFIFLH